MFTLTVIAESVPVVSLNAAKISVSRSASALAITPGSLALVDDGSIALYGTALPASNCPGVP